MKDTIYFILSVAIVVLSIAAGFQILLLFVEGYAQYFGIRLSSEEKFGLAFLICIFPLYKSFYKRLNK